MFSHNFTEEPSIYILYISYNSSFNRSEPLPSIGDENVVVVLLNTEDRHGFIQSFCWIILSEVLFLADQHLQNIRIGTH